MSRPPGSGGRLVAISPHCDDAVLACGDVLACHPGSIVLTVFAGSPRAPGAPTAWDAAAGFLPGDDVMAARRAEDGAALTVVGARPVWLDYHDAQYGPSPRVEDVAARLDATLVEAGAATVLVPLGLFHSDHRLTHDACLVVRRHRVAVEWLCYEEPMYRRIPGLAAAALARLRSAGLVPRRVASVAGVEVRPGPASEAKRKAVECYRSQLRALSRPPYPGYADALECEQYWSVAS